MGLFKRRQAGSQPSSSAESSAYTKIQKGFDRQGICFGCQQNEILLGLFQEGRIKLPSKPQVFHKNYKELDQCAARCATCRIFRQALLLNEPTAQGTARIAAHQSTRPVYAVLGRGPAPQCDLFLSISIGLDRQRVSSALVSCLANNSVGSLILSGDPRSPAVYQQAKQWLEDCHHKHTECGNLQWSRRNPTRLIRILSNLELQLVTTSRTGALLPYVALSYCWGDEKLRDADEQRIIDESLTRTGNLEKRSQFFQSSILPVAIQDVVALTKGLGLEYLWVDSICIIQNDRTDWQQQAATMHEVYGNAHLTIDLSSNDKPTQSLSGTREAWRYATEPCKLGSQWLVTPDMPLSELRARSPLSFRAWTLQEERLSPRILYWSSQRMYWSCSKCQLTELSTAFGRPFDNLGTYKADSSLPQAFLLSLWDGGQISLLHDMWLDIVESYALRDLTTATDRFPALSGLATRYLESQSDDEYLAGLWRKSFSEDLAWSVVVGKDMGRVASLRSFAPSWSWASLPAQTPIKRRRGFHKSHNFDLVEVMAQNTATGSSSDLIVQGANVRRVKVRGLLRPLQHKEWKRRAWFEISRMIDGQEKFLFADNVAQPAYSAHLGDGRVLAYEARRQEILGQLDYLQDAQRMDAEKLRIHCLEIGDPTMLLLEHHPSNDTYTRIGVSHGYRNDFFTSAKMATITLGSNDETNTYLEQVLLG